MVTAAPATLAEALAALQAAMPRVAKDHKATVTSQRTGKTHSYDYADLTDVTEALYPVMAPLGLSFTCRPSMVVTGPDHYERFVLLYTLQHASGDTLSGEYPLPAAGSPQEIGSAITYARRYALCAVTGLAPGGDDDDAQAAQQAAPERKPRNTATDAQLAAEGRMTRQQAAEHAKLEADVKAPGRRAERSRPKAPDPADPWTTDHADYVTGQRAEQIRTGQDQPEDQPGSMMPGQHRAIERMLTMLGIDAGNRDERRGVIISLIDLPGLESMSDLSAVQAAAAIRALQAELDTERAEHARA